MTKIKSAVHISVGTRGSALAVAQTNLVLGQLKDLSPELEFSVKTIKTSGDEGKEILGAFVKEVEQELKLKHIDLAVHSLKDMPTSLPQGVFVAAMPFRGEHRDCLVSRDRLSFMELPSGAMVGTSSLRRSYQLKLIRPDIKVVPIRGNIITRMNKIETGQVDAVVLAAAGLERIGMSDKVTHFFSLDEMVPAVSQGILALEIREDDDRIFGYIKKLTDQNTEYCALGERQFLTALGGGCRMPFGAFARIENNELSIDGIVFNPDGTQYSRGNLIGAPQDAGAIGEELARTLLSRIS